MASPRFINLQISGKTIGNMVLNRARTQVFFAPGTISLEGTNDAIVDHISFDDNPGVILSPLQSVQTVNVAGGGTATVTGNPVRIALGLRIFLKELSVAQDPTQPEATYAVFSDGILTTLSFDLSMQNGNTELCLTVEDLTSALAIPQLTAELMTVKAQLQASGPICFPFDISAIASLVGSVQSQNVVLAAQADAIGNITALDFRIEVGSAPATTHSDWQSFVSNFQSTLATAGPDWNILVDPQIIVDLAASEFQSGLAGMSGYTVDNPVTGSWIVPGQFNGGQIALSDDGHFAVSECPNNIGATITATLDLQFSGGQLVEHGFIDWSLSGGDEFVCGLSYGGPIGALIGTIIAPGIGTIIGAIIGGIVGPIVVAIIASVISGNKSLEGNFNSPNCMVVDQHHVTCTSPLSLPQIDFGNGVNATLTIDKMLGQIDGLLLGGTAAVTPVGDPMFNISQPDATEPLGITGQCFQFQPGYSFSVDLTGSDGPPSGPTTCVYGTYSQPEIDILNDPLNVFTYSLNPDLTQWLPITLNFDINLDQNSPYFANPYQPILYVRTTSGAYSVQLPKLLPFTNAQLAGIEQSIFNADIGCNKLEVGWLGNPGAYNPHWSVDPGPEGDINIWEIVAAGLTASDVVSVHTNQGVQLASANAVGMYAQLSVAVSGVGAQVGGLAPIGFARGTEHSGVGAAIAAAGAAASKALEARVGEKKKISTAVQRSLRRRSAWSALGGVLRSVTLGTYRNRICAMISGSAGVEIVSLQTPAFPTLAAMIPAAAGVMPLAGGLLSWNARGMSYDGRRLTSEPVETVVSRGGYLYALSRSGILIFNSRLAHTGSVAIEGAEGLAAVGRKLVVANAKGLDVYDLASPEKPRHASSFALEGVKGIEITTSTGGMQRVLAELSTGHFEIVDVTGEKPYLAARYIERPWFAGATTLRDVTVRASGAGNIEVFTPGTKKTMRF